MVWWLPRTVRRAFGLGLPGPEPPDTRENLNRRRAESLMDKLERWESRGDRAPGDIAAVRKNIQRVVFLGLADGSDEVKVNRARLACEARNPAAVAAVCEERTGGGWTDPWLEYFCVELNAAGGGRADWMLVECLEGLEAGYVLSVWVMPAGARVEGDVWFERSS